jgi:hypothetical protein
MPGHWPGNLHRSRQGLEVGLIIAIVITVAIAIMLHVIHGAPIALFEAFAKIVAGFSLVRGVLIHLVVIGIGVAMLAVVLSRSFNALVKTALLCVAISRWCRIPAVVVLVLGGARSGLCFMRISFKYAGGCYAESKQGRCEPFFIHKIGTS